MEDKNVKAAETAAKTAAGEWLALIDSGDYASSWKEAAELFKKAVPAADWERMMAASREPLGDLVSRKAASADYATSLPGAPDGEYVVIQYHSSFTRKKQAVETVTPMMEANRGWRVSGYFIK
jgi:hypothetical protein